VQESVVQWEKDEPSPKRGERNKWKPEEQEQMEVREYGQSCQPVVVLLHGGGLSWWNYKDEIAILQKNYHVVIPLLDGHAGSDRPFTSLEESAHALCRYLKERFGGSILAVGGLSLGGQLVAEMLSQEPNLCKYALMESALVLPMTFTNRLLGPSVGMSYGLVKKRWFARLQFRQLRLRPDLFEEYYEDSCKITKENMLAFLKSNTAYHMKASLKNTSANVTVAVGGKEQRKMRDSAKLLHEALPGSKLAVLPHYGHGDLSINHAEEYIALLLPDGK
jgi:pimeloyl-ACP methyl ester carboxylesterase